jgi:hypothetical protein
MQYGRTLLNYLECKYGKQRPRIDNFEGNVKKLDMGCSAIEDEEEDIIHNESKSRVIQGMHAVSNAKYCGTYTQCFVCVKLDLSHSGRNKP